MKLFKTNLNPEELSKHPTTFKRFLASIYCLENYKTEKTCDVERMEYNFKMTGQKYLSKLNFNYEDRIKRYKESIDKNQKLLDEIVKIYKPEEKYYKDIDKKEIERIAYDEYSYLEEFIFKYIMRDWSSEKVKERTDNYGLILKDVKKYFIPGSGNYKFLLPGAGLSRLGYEIANIGFDVETNDYCLFNVIFCDYLFNYCKKNQHTICPFLGSFCNWIKEESPFREYSFPEMDINLEGKGKMTMIGGDFGSLYRNAASQYDCIITCFFIDTAYNIIDYVEIIENVLKKGGIWINFGPLSYHWANIPNEISIELPYEELKGVICNYGFEFLNETYKEACFCEMDENLKNDYYKCIFFTVRKK